MHASLSLIFFDFPPSPVYSQTTLSQLTAKFPESLRLHKSLVRFLKAAVESYLGLEAAHSSCV
jgi:predicted DNA-binding transcriptional regulator AlpA